ncbi:MAG: DUF4339 domain-containing protein [Pirellula sp.]|nr:DUF4339 domain-containing protein [Pirellula sp.]
MGIRFSCHLCNHPLHVKDYQASKRGKCPKCQGAFRVPPKDADFSLAIDESASSIQPANLGKPLAPSDSKIVAATAKPKAATEPKPQVQARTKNPLASTPKPAPEANGHPSMPPSLLPLIDSRWYVRPPSGGQYGPATTQMLMDWIAEKRVTADALLWREGLDSWLSARELVPESFGGSSALGIDDPPPPAVAKPTSPTTKTPTTKTPTASIAPTVPANGPATGPASRVASDPVQPAVPLAKNQAAIAAKKKKQVKRQWMILGFLATMALCLASALIFILTRGL